MLRLDAETRYKVIERNVSLHSYLSSVSDEDCEKHLPVATTIWLRGMLSDANKTLLSEEDAIVGALSRVEHKSSKNPMISWMQGSRSEALSLRDIERVADNAQLPIVKLDLLILIGKSKKSKAYLETMRPSVPYDMQGTFLESPEERKQELERTRDRSETLFVDSFTNDHEMATLLTKMIAHCALGNTPNVEDIETLLGNNFYLDAIVFIIVAAERAASTSDEETKKLNFLKKFCVQAFKTAMESHIGRWFVNNPFSSNLNEDAIVYNRITSSGDACIDVPFVVACLYSRYRFIVNRLNKSQLRSETTEFNYDFYVNDVCRIMVLLSMVDINDSDNLTLITHARKLIKEGNVLSRMPHEIRVKVLLCVMFAELIGEMYSETIASRTTSDGPICHIMDRFYEDKRNEFDTISNDTTAEQFRSMCNTMISSVPRTDENAENEAIMRGVLVVAHHLFNKTFFEFNADDTIVTQRTVYANLRTHVNLTSAIRIYQSLFNINCKYDVLAIATDIPCIYAVASADLIFRQREVIKAIMPNMKAMDLVVTQEARLSATIQDGHSVNGKWKEFPSGETLQSEQQRKATMPTTTANSLKQQLEQQHHNEASLPNTVPLSQSNSSRGSNDPDHSRNHQDSLSPNSGAGNKPDGAQQQEQRLEPEKERQQKQNLGQGMHSMQQHHNEASLPNTVPPNRSNGNYANSSRGNNNGYRRSQSRSTGFRGNSDGYRRSQSRSAGYREHRGRGNDVNRPTNAARAFGPGHDRAGRFVAPRDRSLNPEHARTVARLDTRQGFQFPAAETDAYINPNAPMIPLPNLPKPGGFNIWYPGGGPRK